MPWLWIGIGVGVLWFFLQRPRISHPNMVTVDFDHTLKFEHGGPNLEIIDQVLAESAKGHPIHIVTSRVEHSVSKAEITRFARQHRIPVVDVHFTNGALKADTLFHLGSVLHFDDDDAELAAAEARGIATVNAFVPEEWDRYMREVA